MRAPRGCLLGAWLAGAAILGAQSLDARVHAAAAPHGVTWVGYRAPKTAGPESLCGPERITHIALEPPKEFMVLARIENGLLTRLRTATPDCDIDATGATLVWLDAVTPDDSTAWLSSLVSSPAASTRDWTSHVAEPALAALSMQTGDAASASLIAFARTHPQARVRGQALFWLAHRAGEGALAVMANAVDDDPDLAVKKRAVFALSQLPKDEGVPKLIEIARSHRSAEVRRQAFFWLGQSKDPRAVQFFEEILLRK